MVQPIRDLTVMNFYPGGSPVMWGREIFDLWVVTWLVPLLAVFLRQLFVSQHFRRLKKHSSSMPLLLADAQHFHAAIAEAGCRGCMLSLQVIWPGKFLEVLYHWGCYDVYLPYCTTSSSLSNCGNLHTTPGVIAVSYESLCLTILRSQSLVDEPHLL